MPADPTVREWVIIEYGEPTSPGNRRPFDPVGDGPAVFEATREEAEAFARRLCADTVSSPFRVLETVNARKLRLL
jgi:hypothetical protein